MMIGGEGGRGLNISKNVLEVLHFLLFVMLQEDTLSEQLQNTTQNLHLQASPFHLGIPPVNKTLSPTYNPHTHSTMH